jgi:hypothetical protein
VANLAQPRVQSTHGDENVLLCADLERALLWCRINMDIKVLVDIFSRHERTLILLQKTLQGLESLEKDETMFKVTMALFKIDLVQACATLGAIDF